MSEFTAGMLAGAMAMFLGNAIWHMFYKCDCKRRTP